MKERHPTSLRFTDEDLAVLEKLQKLTGLSAVAAIRLAIRESLAARKTTKR
jgi:hypothetical protein